MGFLITLTYFIIGFGTGLFIYDYHCKDFNKKNKQFELTWEEYSRRENPGFFMGFVMILWPIIVIMFICYYMFQYPIDRIKERNGIK